MIEILQQRIRKLRQAIGHAGIDGLLIVDPNNVSYLTGFLGQDSWALIAGRQTLLLTDSRYIEQARQECPSCRTSWRRPPWPPALRMSCPRSGVCLGVERNLGRDLRAGKSLCGSNLSGVTEALRQIKDAMSPPDSAMRQMRRGMPRPRSCPDSARRRCSWRSGMIEHAIRLRGMKAADLIVCFGPNGSRNHHQPGRKLKANDTILIDLAQKDRATSRLTRSFAVGNLGPVSVGLAGVYDAQQKGIGMIAPAPQAIDAAIRKVIADSGFPPGHGSATVSGLPSTRAVLPPIRKGNCTRPGPDHRAGIYLPGEFGIRIETISG
jgi:Xaa-Pro aminopeptidase